IYVADTGNNTVRKIATDGRVTTLAGMAGPSGSVDGTGAAVRFSSPRGVAVDVLGNVFVADTGNDSVRRIAADGSVSLWVGAAGQPGTTDGARTVARLRAPTDLAIDSVGNLYVAADGAIRKVAPDGMVTTFAGAAGQSGRVAGDGAAARFNSISGVAVDAAGTVFVSESDFGPGSLRRFDSEARSLPLGTATDGILELPFAAGIAADPAGNVYVASGGSIPFAPVFSLSFSSVLKVTPQGAVSVVAGNDQEVGAADGNVTSARFARPRGIAVGSAGRLIVADTENNAVRVIDAQGMVTTVAGGSGAGKVDGPAAQARFFGPRGLATTVDGGLLVADALNGLVRRVSPAGVVSTVAVTDEDGGAVARFTSVAEIALSAQGGFYVLEAPTRFGTVLWRVNASGRRSLVVTNNAAVQGIASDRAGNLYLAELNQVSVITTAGARRVLATGFTNAEAVAVTEGGTVVVADAGDQTVRSYNPGGALLQTVGSAGLAGTQDGAAEQARFTAPSVLALDSTANIYVADSSNTIRRISQATGNVTTIAGVSGQSGAQTGPAIGPLGRVLGLAWNGSVLYATLENAVVKISPVN
ncbi:MAG: NHL repeat-containing protein, partial [Ramlibacter sp.]